MANKIQLTVLEGGRDKQVIINTLLLQVAADTQPSLPVDVRVFEEDTHLVLTVDPIMRHTEEHPIRLMTKVAEAKPNKPGSLIINKKSWYAVIHDVDQDPTWKEEWIEKAYRQVFMLAEIQRVQTIGLPLLGSVHGSFTAEKSLALLVSIVKTTSFQTLKKILILVPHTDRTSIWIKLKEIKSLLEDS